MRRRAVLAASAGCDAVSDPSDAQVARDCRNAFVIGLQVAGAPGQQVPALTGLGIKQIDQQPIARSNNRPRGILRSLRTVARGEGHHDKHRRDRDRHEQSEKGDPPVDVTAAARGLALGGVLRPHLARHEASLRRLCVRFRLGCAIRRDRFTVARRFRVGTRILIWPWLGLVHVYPRVAEKRTVIGDLSTRPACCTRARAEASVRVRPAAPDHDHAAPRGLLRSPLPLGAAGPTGARVRARTRAGWSGTSSTCQRAWPAPGAAVGSRSALGSLKCARAVDDRAGDSIGVRRDARGASSLSARLPFGRTRRG